MPHKLNELKVWQKSIDLAVDIYSVLETLPTDEKFGLISQIKRSVVSVSSNIAEGAGRNSDKEFIQFLGIAQGSLYELQTQITIAQRLKLLVDSRADVLNEKIIEIQKMNYKFKELLSRQVLVKK